jgi:hypothetical protein
VGQLTVELAAKEQQLSTAFAAAGLHVRKLPLQTIVAHLRVQSSVIKQHADQAARKSERALAVQASHLSMKKAELAHAESEAMAWYNSAMDLRKAVEHAQAACDAVVADKAQSEELTEQRIRAAKTSRQEEITLLETRLKEAEEAAMDWYKTATDQRDAIDRAQSVMDLVAKQLGR